MHAITRLFDLHLTCFNGENDPKIELLENIVTSMLIKDEIYIFLQILYTLQYRHEIEAL
jgi:hypothetical protein